MEFSSVVMADLLIWSTNYCMNLWWMINYSLLSAFQSRLENCLLQDFLWNLASSHFIFSRFKHPFEIFVLKSKCNGLLSFRFQRNIHFDLVQSADLTFFWYRMFRMISLANFCLWRFSSGNWWTNGIIVISFRFFVIALKQLVAGVASG